jgi:hypothetical protein
MGEIVSVKRKRRHTFVLGLGDDDTYLIEDSIEREPDRDTSHAPPEKPPDEQFGRANRFKYLLHSAAGEIAAG